MVRDIERSVNRERGWNRLFPTHSADHRRHNADGPKRIPVDPGPLSTANDEEEHLGLLGRVALLAASAFAFNVGFRVQAGPETLWVLLGMLAYGSALICLISAFLAREAWSNRIQTLVAILLASLIALAVGYEITVLNPNYATDVMAFAHGGAEILLDGNNPYAASPGAVDQIAERFGVSLTRTTDGGVIDWLISYPALHVLTFTALIAAEFADLRWGTLIIELIALTLIWRAMSPKGRLLAPFVLLMEPFLSVIFTGGGVTDWLWVLPLALTAISLHRRQFGYAGIALGLACAVKQHPWFVVPFVLIWVVQTLRSEGDGRLTGEGRRSIAGFAAGATAGFMVPNLPFIIWDPAEWFEGVMSPALGGMVADGHGIAALVARGVLDLQPGIFLALIAAAFLGAIVLYARRFERLQDLLWVLPPVIMFLSFRSLHSYFVFWLPIALLWLDLRAVGGRKSRAVHPSS